MSNLGLIIRATQRDAAALSTGELRREIEINLDVQDAAIRQYYATIQPGGRERRNRSWPPTRPWSRC